jgi:lysine 2,3-aminomutase
MPNHHKRDDWKRIFSSSRTDSKELKTKFSIDAEKIEKVIEQYPMRINPYYESLIKEKGDGIWIQSVPDEQELTYDAGIADPLCEEDDQSGIPGLTHRYPDRVLLLVSNICAMYCRFCTRKRKVGKHYETITQENFEKALDYIKEHKEIRDVILSGGDPLMLDDDKLEHFIKHVREIPHVEIIRIGSRVPCALPMRITPELCSMLKKYHPIYINTHFNNPAEITPEAKKACEMLADAGIPLGNQSVLMKGVNDDPEVMKELVQKLLAIRVKPYYVYIPDNVKGTRHLAPSIEQGLKVMHALRGWTSGMAVPQLVVDIEGGGGKIPVLPEYLKRIEGNKYFFENYLEKEFVYEEEQRC